MAKNEKTVEVESPEAEAPVEETVQESAPEAAETSPEATETTEATPSEEPVSTDAPAARRDALGALIIN